MTGQPIITITNYEKTFLLLCIAALLTSSCSSSKNSLGSIMQILNDKWALQSIAGQTGLGDLFGGQMPFLQFDTQASRVSGNNGCNSLTGPLKIEAGNKISFDNIASTRKACPGQRENVFMNALKKVTNFKVDNGVLKLLSQGEEVMKYGMNFSDFINRYRIDYAKEKLRDPQWRQLTLEGVAMEVGFNNRITFFRTFTKLTGTTPSEYLNEQITP